MRVLLIEDNSSLARILKRDFKEIGIKTTVAENGADGLHFCLNWDFDLILIDVDLPNINGWTILEKLRKIKTTPTIMLTANSSLADRVKGLSGGADDYVCKPFHFDELVARMKALHRRSSDAVNNQIQIGSHILNLDNGTLTEGENAIQLTSREFDILHHLAINRGKIVSRDALYDLFSVNESVSMASIDVHICNLRKKIDKNTIRTIRRKGYILDI